jgi:hypothetical protein
VQSNKGAGVALNYDFDIFSLDAPGSGPDRETTDFLSRLGLAPRKGNSLRNMAATGQTRIALFRDATTADALRRAPGGLRAYFLTAGFGLNAYASGAPRHRYPVGDEGARLEIIERLTAIAPDHDLPAPEDYSKSDDVFRLGEFLAELAEARPTEAGLAENGPATDADLAPPDKDGSDGLPPTCDLDSETPRRRFWRNRYFQTAVWVGVAALVLELASAINTINLAGL